MFHHFTAGRTCSPTYLEKTLQRDKVFELQKITRNTTYCRREDNHSMSTCSKIFESQPCGQVRLAVDGKTTLVWCLLGLGDGTLASGDSAGHVTRWDAVRGSTDVQHAKTHWRLCV